MIVPAAGLPLAFGQDSQELIQNITEQQKKIQTLIANFLQKKETRLVKDPLLSSGSMKFKRPDRIHFIYKNPEPMEIALDRKTIWIYTPQNSQVEKYSLTRGKKMAPYLDPIIGIFQKPFRSLAEEYTISYQGAEGEGKLHFLLLPKEEKIKKFLSHVDLRIDKISGSILRFMMVEVNGDHLTLEFKDLQFNPPLTDEDLQITIPPSARVVEESGR
jgi:outer membrane lipoprotein-sorting protein